MKTLMRNGRDRRSENPSLGHAKKERVSLFGTDQRITSGPAARRPHSKAEYMTAPERFADSQIPLAPRAPPALDRTAEPTIERLQITGARIGQSRGVPGVTHFAPSVVALAHTNPARLSPAAQSTVSVP